MGASQVELEELYSKYQLHDCIAREFRAEGFEGELEEMGVPGRFGIDLLVQMQLHKRATIPTLVGLLKKHFADHENPAQACADMILKAAEVDAIEVLDQTDPIAVVIFEMDEETQEKLDQTWLLHRDVLNRAKGGRSPALGPRAGDQGLC